MPVVRGLLNQRPVSVLRDTGSNTVIVRSSLVEDANLTGKTGVVILVNGAPLQLPEARVKLCSPYFTGDLSARHMRCMDAPLYDVTVGNVEGARRADEPDLNRNGQKMQPISEGEITETREDSRDMSNISAAHRLIPSEKTNASSEVKGEEVTFELLKERQKSDDTLQVCRHKIGQVYNTKDESKYNFYISKGVLCRRFEQQGGKFFMQVVVPTPLRRYVLEVALESVMAGQQGIKRTIDRVLEAFYWPGV
ncbi:unnamed protein product [Ixodes pacificus]